MPNHCSAPYSSNRSTSVNPSFAATVVILSQGRRSAKAATPRRVGVDDFLLQVPTPDSCWMILSGSS